MNRSIRCWTSASKAGLVLGALTLALLGQEQPRIAFEIASVRPSPPAGTPGRSTGLQGTHYESHGNILRLLIVIAFDTLPHQLVTPDWLSQDQSRNAQKFDIVATAPAGTTRADVPRLFQSLLADRFGLKVHREKRPMDTYVVVEAKGGHKMKPVAADAKNAAERLPGGLTRYTGSPYDWIQGIVGTRSDRPIIVDFPGRFEMILNTGAGTPPPTEPGAEPATPRDPYSVMSDMLEPAGLRLERRRVPVDVVVVDQVEKMPTEN